MTTINLKGTISHTNGNVIPNISVSLSEKALRSNKPIKQIKTKSKGSYSFEISKPPIKVNTAYIIEVKDMQGKIMERKKYSPLKIKNHGQ